ncbi:hypothetical protein Dimus_016742 [Dionaea muscipula]
MKLNYQTLLLIFLTSLFVSRLSLSLSLFSLPRKFNLDYLKDDSQAPSPAPAAPGVLNYLDHGDQQLNADHSLDDLDLLDDPLAPSPAPADHEEEEEEEKANYSIANFPTENDDHEYYASDQAQAAAAPSTSSSSSSSAAMLASLESLLRIPENLKAAAPTPSQVLEACNKTEYPAECEATLLGSNANAGDDGKGKLPSNPVKILDSSVEVFSKALEIAKSEISRKKPGVSKADNSDRETCKEMYENAIEELNKAVEAADSGDKFEANIRLSAALTFIETCEDGLHGTSSAEDSSIDAANQMLSKMASNSLALGNFALGIDQDD